jgi:hypothetical protein
MLVAVPSPAATDEAVVSDAPPGRPAGGSGVAPDLVRLALVAAVDAVFLFGVVLAYHGHGVAGGPPDWLGLPALLSVFFLPWVTFGSAAVSGYRLRRGTPGAMSLGIRVLVVVLGVAGLATYFSPTGVDAIRWLMD